MAEGGEDVTVKVSDEGGGIPRSGLARIWTYLYSTAKSRVDVEQLQVGVCFVTEKVRVCVCAEERAGVCVCVLRSVCLGVRERKQGRGKREESAMSSHATTLNTPSTQ